MSFFIISPELYAWVILPLLIFFARICDVSMETIRVIYISRGIKFLAPIIAFFEIVIWLLAMEVVMQDCPISQTSWHSHSGLPRGHMSAS